MAQRIAKFNKQPFPGKEFNKAVENSRNLNINEKKSYTIVDLLRYPVLRKRSLILGITWYVLSVLQSPVFQRFVNLMLYKKLSNPIFHFNRIEP